MTPSRGRGSAKTPAWRASTDEFRVETMKDALTAANGNNTEAAELVHVHRSHAMRLVKKFELVEYARRLRVKGGVSSSGLGAPRPKTQSA